MRLAEIEKNINDPATFASWITNKGKCTIPVQWNSVLKANANILIIYFLQLEREEAIMKTKVKQKKKKNAWGNKKAICSTYFPT